jgi:ribosome-associated protein YbcJ (S4-like RNA binding protein)
VQEIALTSEHITLGQLLKLAGLLDTGGEARAFLDTTDVSVNGEPEQRRGRKLRAGDLVEVAGSEPIRLA